jgi:hypothetical protein
MGRGGMIMDIETEIIWEEVVVACFKVMSRHLSGPNFAFYRLALLLRNREIPCLNLDKETAYPDIFYVYFLSIPR